MNTVPMLLRGLRVVFLKLSICLSLVYLPCAWSNHAHEEKEHGHHEEGHKEDHKKGHEEEHEEGHHGEGHEDDHHEEGVTHIDDDMAQKVGIVTAAASAKTLYQTITTYGRLVGAPEKTSHVLARFSGVIISVEVAVGDSVVAGDLLAVVESNDSLKEYQIRAPISGVVVHRHANAGEITGEQMLFAISNFDNLWLELRVFPSQRAAVAKGQKVFMHIGEQRHEARVEHVLPTPDEQPYLVARANIDNRHGMFSPGLMAEGHIVVAEFDVAVAVAKEALQTVAGQTGVFVKRDNAYTFTPVIVGRQDDRYVEILSGLDDGTAYVTQNSYLLKADIEKSEAEHVH